LMLEPDALVDLGSPLWGASPFTAILLGPSKIDDVVLPPPREPVVLLAATPITATEAAWVRLKGADAMREAWQADGVDVLDPSRGAARPSGD
jgi:suppressor of fused protein SUFU